MGWIGTESLATNYSYLDELVDVLAPLLELVHQAGALVVQPVDLARLLAQALVRVGAGVG